ncbi:Pre-mRNA-splicing factor SPF27 [Panaeolus papilionaceus]|nr:Pre-mRNA-splicing factor SPF27 [Panaeolus papilionaceus]
MTTHSETVLFDSLPYYDDDLQKYPELRQKVDQELTREQQKGSTDVPHPRLAPPITLFSDNPLLQAEMKRVAAGQSLPPLDKTRYTLPEPTSTPSTPEEWKSSLDNAYAQLQHQKIRQNNLTLLQTYGANGWRIQNYLLEQTAKNIETSLEELKELTVEVNRERKNQQDRAGKQLTALETRWTELISGVLQIEMANVALESEIDQLNKREVELSQL